MRNHKVYVEINGNQTYVGDIRGRDQTDVSFIYAPEYLHGNVAAPVSISLPLQKEPHGTEQTRIFFEGLLPEGFTRRTVASWLHVDEYDYMSILGALGRECLGAIRILDGAASEEAACYEELSMEQVKALAREGAGKSAELVTKAHLSLTGATGKVGLYYHDGGWLLPKADAPSTHILKQSHVRLDSIVLNEQLCQLAAHAVGVETADSFIVNTGAGMDADVLFASRRYDREFTADCPMLDGVPRPFRLHQEDFSQAMGIPASEKYEREGQHYLADMFEVLRRYSENPIEDSFKLWDMVVYDFLVGNADNHIKNHSLLYSRNLKTMRLAPAYDMVSTCVYETSTRDMAMNIGGKYSLDEIGRADFAAAAADCGISSRAAMRRFDALADRFEAGLETAAEKLLAEGMEHAPAMAKRILENCGYAHL